MREAVGCWICWREGERGRGGGVWETEPGSLTISCRRTFPSFVSFMSPAPDTNLGRHEQRFSPRGSRRNPNRTTHIFRVPRGPRLVLSTSCSPRAPAVLMASACAALATSALGLRLFTADISYPSPCLAAVLQKPHVHCQLAHAQYLRVTIEWALFRISSGRRLLAWRSSFHSPSL